MDTSGGDPPPRDVVKRYTWTTDTLIGLLYSSSTQLRAELGARVGEFGRDLRERLIRLAPDDRFVEDMEFTIISAKPHGGDAPIRILGVSAHQQDLRLGPFLLDAPRQLQPVQARHH